MAKRPPESLKETANQLANLMINGSDEREKMQALEQKLAAGHYDPDMEGLQSSPGIDITPKKDSQQDGRMGIWIPRWKEDKKYYIRDEKYMHQFNQWAKIHEIPPKGPKKRIICLGESVFRGTFLDPFYTPVSVLQNILDSKLSSPRVELIDLALTDCSMNMLIELFSASIALEPDFIVIFAGNNWTNSFKLFEELTDKIINEMLAGERFTGLKRILEDQYKEMISSFMKQVDYLSKNHHVPVVYVIPEFNLLDYQSNSFQRINMWPTGETEKWLNLQEEIREKFEEGDIEKAELLCHEMIELNEGNPYGFERLAQCKLKRGFFSEATKYLRMALDTAMFRGQNVPCCISVVRKSLQKEAAKYKIPVVDLSEVFKHSQGGRPPGRELFLDYCHLSYLGIQIAMAATAQKLISILADEHISTEELLTAAPKPDSDVIARSHFFAAIHNAHRGEQPKEILYYHCRQALESCDIVKDLIMLDFIDMASRHTVWVLSKACEKLLESGQLAQFPSLSQPDNHYIIDIDLVDAMVTALKERGIDLEERISTLRKKEHGFVKNKIDLLESYYHLTSYAVSYRPNNSYYLAFTPQSRFFLVSGNDNDVLLNITYRVPGLNRQKKKVYFKINDSIIQELPAVNEWNNTSLELPKELLKNDINVITLEWPPGLKFEKNVSKDRSPANWQKTISRMMYPSYGEIHMFTAEKSK